MIPGTFFFEGYGVHLRWQPKECGHMLFGIGGYAMNMPDAIVDMNEKNKDQGWEVRLNQGVSLFGEYHFSEVNQKAFVGVQAGVQEYKLENEGITGSEKVSNALLMGYGGYTFPLFKSSFYAKTLGRNRLYRKHKWRE